MEEQELADDVGAGLEMDRVGRAVEPAPGRLLGRKDVEAADADFADPQRFVGQDRRRGAQGQCGKAQGEDRPADYVPSSQELMYFFCSGVGVSIAMPIEASFRRAISRSISSGTV